MRRGVRTDLMTVVGRVLIWSQFITLPQAIADCRPACAVDHAPLRRYHEFGYAQPKCQVGGFWASALMSHTAKAAAATGEPPA
jgi:hypothetical protein